MLLEIWSRLVMAWEVLTGRVLLYDPVLAIEDFIGEVIVTEDGTFEITAIHWQSSRKMILELTKVV